MKSVKNYKIKRFKLLIFLFLAMGTVWSCKDKTPDITEKKIVKQPEDINASAEDVIRSTLKEILRKDEDLPDSFHVKNALVLQHLYDENSYEPIWSSKGSFNRDGDSLYALIGHLLSYGLFPNDYYFSKLGTLKIQLADTSKEKKLDASLWAYSDLLLSSAFVQIIKDLRVGRLVPDSIVEKDTTLTPAFFAEQLRSFQQQKDSVFEHLEPASTGYKKLKEALAGFLPHARFKKYTLVASEDSTLIPGLLYQRLGEEDSTLVPEKAPDSVQVARAIRRYQKKKGLKADGRMSEALIRRLNSTDREKLIRIAINLDRYKLLKPMPDQYVWVNIPEYYLQLIQGDSVLLKSRVVVGKPTTRTPLITSVINNMITYPKWTIPESIIKKEILPALKKDPGYTLRKGYSLVDKDGNEIDPLQVKWGKFETYIPYKVVQGSGDDNALGVLKFNFPNDYSVYLHDTNQRYLFSKTERDLSHGCVRVQAWEELAKFILRNDSLNAPNPVPLDSLENWLATKQKKYVPVRKPIPLFIRYFTADVNEQGKLVFYDDIYEEDLKIREKLFSGNIL